MAKPDYNTIINSAGQRYNVDPALIRAVISTETGGEANPNTAVSSTGAVGVGQLMPATAKALGVTNPTDPTQNINGAAKLLDQLLTQSNGNVQQALTMYHGGQNPDNWGPLTQAYPGKVFNALGANVKTLPGIPASTSAAQPAPQMSDDDVFKAFSKSASQPAAAAQSAAPAMPQMSDDDIFKTFTQPVASSAAPAQSATPGAATAATAPAAQPSGFMQNVQDVIKQANYFPQAAAHNIGNAAIGAGQLALHGLGGIESGIQSVIGGSTVLPQAAQALDQYAAQREAAYQQQVPNVPTALAGAAAGQVAPFLASGGASAVTKGGQIASRLAEMLGGGERAQGIAGLAGQSAGSAALGAGTAAVQPVTQPGDFAAQKAQQVGEGAALGAAIPGAMQALGGAARGLGNTVGSLVRPFTESGQNRIAANVIQNAAGTSPLAAAQSAQIPGVQPTLAEMTGNPGVAALQRALASRPGNEALALRQTANTEARNAFAGQITGTPQDIAALQAARDSTTAPMLQQAFQNAQPVNPQPVLDAIDAITNSPQGKRPAIAAVMNNVKNMVNSVTAPGTPSAIVDAAGNPVAGGAATAPSADPAALYQSVRKGIGDLLESQNPEVRSNVKAVQQQLLGVRNVLDDTIEQGAPGFAAFRQAYSDASQPISALQTLQGMNLLGADGTAPVTLAKVRTAIGKIQDAQTSPNSRNLDLQAVSPDQLSALTNLRDSLLQQQGLNAGQNAVRGSTTYQNLANGSILDAQQPALVRLLLNGSGRGGTVGGVTGSLAGSMLGGPGGAATGAALGAQAGAMFGGALRSKAPEVEARVLDMLLNPQQSLSTLSAPAANRFPLAASPQLRGAAAGASGVAAGQQQQK